MPSGTPVASRLREPMRSGLAKALVVLAATVLVGRQLYWLVLPYFTGNGTLATFRDDNYWSFTSGFVRRALLGEFLYAGTLVAGQSVAVVLSIVFVIAYACILVTVLRLLATERSSAHFLLLLGTPLVIAFQIDREVLLLVPMLILHATRNMPGAQLVGFATAIPAVFVHEFAALLYVPYFMALYAIDQRPQRVVPLSAAVVVAAVALPIALVRVAPSYVLERNFWPAFGVTDLESTHLYRFASMALGDGLAFHGHLLTSTTGGLVNVAFALLAVSYLVTNVIRHIPVRAAFVMSVLPMLVLTIDYGRYAYLLLAFCVMGNAVASARVGPSDRSANVGVPGRASSLAVLALLALAPVSHWAGPYDVPSAVRVIKEISGPVGRILRAANA